MLLEQAMLCWSLSGSRRGSSLPGWNDCSVLFPCPLLREAFKRDWIVHSKGRTMVLLVSTQSQLEGPWRKG